MVDSQTKSNFKPRPQLHFSMLNQAYHCGQSWLRQYGRLFNCYQTQEIPAPTLDLIIGTTVHKAIEEDLIVKMNHGHLLPLEDVHGIARATFRSLYQTGVRYTEEEAEDIEGAIENSINMALNLITLYHENVAVDLDPVSVEEKFVIILPDKSFDLAGQMDIREKGTIRDIKTRGQTPSENAANNLQFAMYSMAHLQIYGELPRKVFMDCLIKNKTPKLIIREAVPGKAWIDVLMSRIDRLEEMIKAQQEGRQVFQPADPDSWICSRKFCSFATDCEFWSGR